MLSISPKGKSTSAQLLARKHGYVFYEGDCFFTMRLHFANDCCDQLHFPRNPFIPVDSKDPSLDQLKQRKLVQSFWSNSNSITVQLSSSLYFLCPRLDQGRMRGGWWLEKAQKHTSWGQYQWWYYWNFILGANILKVPAFGGINDDKIGVLMTRNVSKPW